MTTTRTLCPLDCGWHHDEDLADRRFDFAPFLESEWPTGANPLAASLVAVRHLLAEKAIREHLETHGLIEWVKALTTAQRARRAGRGCDRAHPGPARPRAWWPVRLEPGRR